MTLISAILELSARSELPRDPQLGFKIVDWVIFDDRHTAFKCHDDISHQCLADCYVHRQKKPPGLAGDRCSVIDPDVVARKKDKYSICPAGRYSMSARSAVHSRSGPADCRQNLPHSGRSAQNKCQGQTEEMNSGSPTQAAPPICRFRGNFLRTERQAARRSQKPNFDLGNAGVPPGRSRRRGR